MKEQFLQLVDGEWHKNADYWGVAMGAAFDVASVMYDRNLPNVLDYRPGVFGPDPIEDEWRAEYLAAMDDATLTSLAAYTKRILDALERKGLSY